MLLIMLSFLFSGCVENAIIKHDSIYIVNNSNLYFSNQYGPYIFLHFRMDKLLTYSNINGNPQARIEIKPNSNNIETEHGKIFLTDEIICKELKENYCLINLTDDRLNSITPVERYYSYLAVYHTTYLSETFPKSNSINILNTDYRLIKLMIIGQSKPFKSMKSKSLILHKEEINNLLLNAINEFNKFKNN